MSYALRNTILLGAFWLLIILAGVYQVHFRMKTTEEELVAREKVVSEELELDQALVASLPDIERELAEVQYRWDHREKVIPASETSHETYAYLDEILSRYKTTLNFDYAAVEERDSVGIRFADYQVVGEARYLDLHRFIYYLEHLPRYLQINDLSMEESYPESKSKKSNSRWVKFVLNMTAISADRPGFDQLNYAADVQPPQAIHDPFRPLRSKRYTIPPNTRGLINIYKSNLRALTATQAYIVDQNGKLKILNLGDEVYLGRLVDIIPESNRAIFNLTKLHPPRKVPLVIQTGK
jgi:Tfp pilus assembly protein PilO